MKNREEYHVEFRDKQWQKGVWHMECICVTEVEALRELNRFDLIGHSVRIIKREISEKRIKIKSI